MALSVRIKAPGYRSDLQAGCEEDGGVWLPTSFDSRFYRADQKNSSWMLSGSRKVSIAFEV
jgi:hypothetical protein